MIRRWKQPTAVSFAVLAAVQMVFSFAAVGHRHLPAVDSGYFRVSASGEDHSAHSHDAHHHDHATHSPHAAHASHHSCRSGTNPAGEVPENHSHDSSNDDCSICRYLAQLVVPLQWQVELVSAQLSDVVTCVTSFDVTDPAHRFPQPRSPPTAS